MFEMYVENEGKKLRCGYIIGLCSVGVVKVVIIFLFNKEENLSVIEIDIFKKINIIMLIEFVIRGEDFVECIIIKFSGDDFDVISGIEIKVKVCKLRDDEEIVFFKDFNDFEGFDLILFKGGIGVGVVIKDGFFI